MPELTAEAVTEARAYIKLFCEHTIPGTRYVDTTDRRITLANMSDADALWVAEQFKLMELEAARRKSKSGRRLH